MAKSKSSEEIIENFSRNAPVDTNLKKFLPFAAAFMACIDGQVHQNEIDKISELGKKFLGSKFVKTEFLQSVEDVSSLLANADDTLFTKWETLTLQAFSGMTFSSDEEKQALIAFFCELAFADGSVHEKEAQFVDKLSDAIGFVNPFELKTDDNANKSELEVSSTFTQGAEAFGMIAKMLTDAMVESGAIPKERRLECLMAATRAVTANMEKSIALINHDEKARIDAFLFLSEEINVSLGLSRTPNKSKQKYSSTVYADSHEELVAKNRKVSIYASLGLFSIFGYLGSFGYSIYLFFDGGGNPILWAAIGVALFVFQKWVGKRHDELTG